MNLSKHIRLAGFALAAGLQAGCASTSEQAPAPTKYTLGDFEARPAESQVGVISDPLEPFNRSVYRFNWFIDQLILLPMVELYQLITPDVIETGVSNFFANINEIPTFANAVLQGKFASAGTTLNRFVINSTAGFLGVVDQASKVDIHRQNEDFGQTLGFYGVGHGPYLVLPVLGPSNLRDATGLFVDYAAYNVVDPLGEADFERDHYWYTGLKIIDKRKNIPFRYYESGTPFEYEWVRELYTRYRELEISN